VTRSLDSGATAQPARFVVVRVVTLASRSGRYGGPYDTALRQCEILEARGLNCRLVAGHLAGDEARDERVLSREVRRWLPAPDFVALCSGPLLRLLWREVRAADVTFVSFARELVPLVAAAIAVISYRPLAIQPHGMLTSRSTPLHHFVDAVARPLARRAGLVVALTDREERELRQWFGARSSRQIDIIGNPSPEPTGDALEGPGVQGTQTVLFAGRLHPRKRVSDFIDAAEACLAINPNLNWQVAGPDHGDLPLVLAAAARLRNFEYVGVLTRDDLTRAVARSAVFVLASRDEPWGNVLVTAIKWGVPVVVTRSSALAKEVELLRAGLVVDDGTPEQIADAAVALATGAVSFEPHADAIRARFSNQAIAEALGFALNSAAAE